MNQSFVLKDLDINLPAQQVSVKIGELSMNVENANVLEIAQSYGQMMKSFLHLKAELEKDQISNSDEESPFGEIVLDGEEGHRDAHTFSAGDFVQENGTYAGYIIEVFPDDSVEYIITEVGSPHDTSFFGTRITAYTETLQKGRPGTLKFLAGKY